MNNPLTKRRIMANSKVIVDELLANSAIHVGRPIAGLTRDIFMTRGLDTIRSWLDTCLQSHHSCSGNIQSSLPTRVVVQERNANGERKYRLWEPPSNATGRYACLSHCWGKKPVCRTTRSPDTYTLFRKEIPVNQLSRTFRDALDVADVLGIDKLWIDSLCIIQDDKVDWARESTKMAEIYEGAYVTIAATAASDGSQGCFNISGEAGMRPRTFHLPHAEGSGPSSTIHTRERLEHWFDNSRLDMDGFRSETFGLEDVFPLLTRAWVFQERLLSPRMLHFTRDELVWECAEETACQCSGRAEPVEFWSSLPKSIHSAALQGTVTGPTNLGTRWRLLVEGYSALRLTKDGDRLPALAGLAEQMGRYRPGTRYLSGLWEDDLFCDMSWVARGGDATTLDVSRKHRAPSWSWAAAHFTMSISYLVPPDQPEIEAQPLVRILHMQFLPENLGSGRATEHGFVTVGGRVSEATMAMSSMQWSASFPAVNGKQESCELVDVYLDEPGPPGLLGRVFFLAWLVSGWGIDPPWVFSGQASSRTVRRAYIILSEICSTHALFQRIGVCQLKQSGKQDSFETVFDRVSSERSITIGNANDGLGKVNICCEASFLAA